LQVLEPVVVGKIEKRLGELHAGCQWAAGPQLRRHLREYILPGLAVYQALRAEGQSQETALASVNGLIALVVAPQRRQMAWLGRFPLVYPLLRLMIRPVMRQYPADGWQIKWLENSRDAIRFDMRSCFYFDTLSRLGAPELTASFCHGDDLVYGQMSPYVEWRRTQTIGQGAKYCDFCLARARRGAEGRQ
jgi:hypothetical protein